MRTSLFPRRRSLAVIVAVCFAVAHGSAVAATVQVFPNNTPITISDTTTATPYPSNITVSAVAPATVTKVSVILSQFSHTFPLDVDVLLVGPQGQRCILMSDAGGGNPGVSNVSLTFSSTAATVLPQAAPPATGSYRPANYVNDSDVNDFSDTFPAPLPAPNTLVDAPVDLSVFNLTDPNGVWSLYVLDDNGTDVGSIGNGWLLVLTVPAVFTVNSTADTDDGACNTSPDCTLREAVTLAQNGDLINFSSLFNTPQTINLLTTLPDITRSVTIQGPGANLLTVRRAFDATTDFRIFNIPGGGLNVAISGMSIAGGRATGDFGGGINSLSNLTLTDVHVTGNHAGSSTAGGGGGVGLGFADGVFTNCTVSGNTTANSGGGINYEGGGGHTLHVVNSTVSGNRANFGGGGILNITSVGHSQLEVVGSTIANNTGGNSGGIFTFTEGGAGSTATTTLRNTIIAGNTSTNLATGTSGGGAATFATLGFNLSDNYTGGGFTPLGSDITSATPRLGPLSLGGGTTPTHALLGGSPALDFGDASGLTTDQRGQPRVFNVSADIGAVEMRPIYVGGTGNTGSGSLRFAITEANLDAGLDDIIFSAPLFESTQIINLLAALPDITSSVTINGPGANLLTVRRDNAAADFRIFNIASGITGGVAISGMTITGGRSTAPGDGQLGGGIYSNASSLTLTNVHLTGNHAGSGGGVYLFAADGVFTGCTFSGNTAEFDGGGIDFFGNGGRTLRLLSSTVSDNQVNTQGGAGISNTSSNGHSRLEVVSSTIANNTGIIGGGIETVTFSDTGNTATTTLRNTIIAGNTSANLVATVLGGGAATFITHGFNLTSDSGGDFLNVPPITTDKINTPAGLAALLDNGGTTPTHALLSGSAAIDAGNNSGSGVLTDQRGGSFLRTVELPATNAANSDGTDIGAFEAQTSPTPQTVLGNISTRLRVEIGDDVLFAGMIVSGTQPKRVIIRGTGTSLAIADKLANPTLELHGPSGLIEANDNWVDSPNKQAIIDSTVAPSNDLEPAIIATLPANNSGYTAILRGANNGTGIGVIEAYDLDPSVDSMLANISTRGLVQTGDNVLFAGTIVVGPASRRVIVRAIAPSLSVVGKMADPKLELRDQNGTVFRENDNWVDSPDKDAIIATTIPPTNDLESAIVVTLPGNNASYTAIVRGVNDSTGIALVEVYALEN